jgi:phage FluMu protein Com
LGNTNRASRVNSYEGPPQFPIQTWAKNKEWARAIERSSTLASNQYERNGFINGRQYLRYGNYNLISQSGLIHLFRMRTGSFLTTQRLEFMGFVSPDFKYSCPFCRLQEAETVAHLLVSCPRWKVFEINLRELDTTRCSQNLNGLVLMGYLWIF